MWDISRGFISEHLSFLIGMGWTFGFVLLKSRCWWIGGITVAGGGWYMSALGGMDGGGIAGYTMPGGKGAFTGIAIPGGGGFIGIAIPGGGRGAGAGAVFVLLIMIPGGGGGILVGVVPTSS